MNIKIEGTAIYNTSNLKDAPAEGGAIKCYHVSASDGPVSPKTGARYWLAGLIELRQIREGHVYYTRVGATCHIQTSVLI